VADPLIRIHDLATLLAKSIREVNRWLVRTGVKVVVHHGQPAVRWPALVERLDVATARKIKNEVRKRHFDLNHCTWTVASFPELAELWDQKRNGSMKPGEVRYRSDKTVWWKCDVARDHRWQEAPSSRIQKRADGSYRVLGCPFCSHHRISPRDSLARAYPAVAREWHPQLNGDLRPIDMPPRANKMVWWRCSKGHEWQTVIAARTRLGAGCPYCAKVSLTPENTLAARQPGLAAEWHPSKNGALKPTDVASCSSHRQFWWKCPAARDHEWQATAGTRSRSPRCPFCTNRRLAPSNCLQRRFPGLARQWHPRRNGALTPDGVIATSRRLVWWKCPKASDHEWDCRIEQRVRKKSGCPFCAGKRVCKSNCLATLYPKVAAQWHPLRNGTLSPANVLATSKSAVWWRCPSGHEWRAPIHARSALGRGCPICLEFGVSKRRQ
jgi:hypothetical protein